MLPEPFFYISTLSALAGLYYLKKFKGTKYIYFIYFIFFTFFIDKLNYLNRIFKIITYNNGYNNKPILNVYVIVTFIFFFWFYKQIFHNQKNKKLMNIFTGIFITYLFIELFYYKTNFFNDFVDRVAVLGSVLLVITLVLISIEFLKNQKHKNNIERYFLFWITLGLFLFYIGILPTLIASNIHLFKGFFKYILVVLNSFAHLAFIIGIILYDKKYTY